MQQACVIYRCSGLSKVGSKDSFHLVWHTTKAINARHVDPLA